MLQDRVKHEVRLNIDFCSRGDPRGTRLLELRPIARVDLATCASASSSEHAPRRPEHPRFAAMVSQNEAIARMAGVLDLRQRK